MQHNNETQFSEELPKESILEDLYYGNLCPCENDAALLNAKNRAVRQEMKEQLAAFRSSLTQEQQVLFQKILDQQLQLLSLEHAATFAAGFRLGGQIILEVLRPTK